MDNLSVDPPEVIGSMWHCMVSVWPVIEGKPVNGAAYRV